MVLLFFVFNYCNYYSSNGLMEGIKIIMALYPKNFIKSIDIRPLFKINFIFS